MKFSRRSLAATGIASFAALGMALPSGAVAGEEYYLGAPGSWGLLYGYNGTNGARHSLTRISVRAPGTSPSLCVYGADGNNINVRNTAYYCITSGDLAAATLGGVLRYPKVENQGPGALNGRALSEW